MKIVLASNSPRRKELLKHIVKDFVVDAKEIDETLDLSLSLDQALEQLASRKAKAVLGQHPDALIIGSDTVVVLDEKVLGKPKDREDAIQTLKNLSGREHLVKTSFALLYQKKEICFTSTCTVHFMSLTDKEIEEYVDSGEPFQKAGSYGIQGLASKFIEKINGDYYTVVGLPVNLIYRHLKEFL